MTELHEEGEIKSIENDSILESTDFICYPASNNISSYTSLIRWNISKALKENPRLDLKEALKEAKSNLQISPSARFDRQLCPEGYYLSCALLAWQNIGHNNPEQLFEFIIHNTLVQNEYDFSQSNFFENQISPFNKSSTIGSASIMHVEPTVVMRIQNDPKMNCCKKTYDNKENKNNNNTKRNTRNVQIKEPNENNKNLDEMCCKEIGCAEKLKAMDNTTTGLRQRAEQLAKREAERIELLERAESAWKDLERGYQRRVKLAEEKEYSMTKQIEKLLEERNEAKEYCTELALKLKDDGTAMQQDRLKLAEIEKKVRDRASLRHRIFEESAKGDTGLAEQQIKASQIDRDLQFKEQQAQRTLTSLTNEVESMKMLRYESERAMRLDMADLKEQAQVVSKQLLDQDDKILTLKDEINELKNTKEQLSKEVEGCSVKCDESIQQILDELKKKREQLQELKDRILQCRCKVPIDESVQVKRTPSIAVLCHCLPDEKVDSECISCSCTSLRSSLMSNLLSDLFDGLRSEMGTGLNMSCQLLKCLEDKHNWDLNTPLKSNLVDFFSNLLLKELNIAIATSIEKYHAKWIGATCADTARLLEESQQNEVAMSEAQERMQARAIELRAQELATKLAQELFNQKAEKLAEERAKEIIAAGPPPCECKAKKKEQVNLCILDTKPKLNQKNTIVRKNNDVITTYWFKTHKDITELRTEIESLKKDSIKKEDLRSMENKITTIVKKAALMERTIKCTKDEINLKKVYDHSNICDREFNHYLSSYLNKTSLKNSNFKSKNKYLHPNAIRPTTKTIKHETNYSKSKYPIQLNKNNISSKEIDFNIIKSKSNLIQIINPVDSIILSSKQKNNNLDNASSDTVLKDKQNIDVYNATDDNWSTLKKDEIVVRNKDPTENVILKINNDHEQVIEIHDNIDIKDNIAKSKTTLQIANKNVSSINNNININPQILNTIRNVALTNINDFVTNSYPRIKNINKIMEIVNKCKILSHNNEIRNFQNNKIKKEPSNINIAHSLYSDVASSSFNYSLDIKELEENVHKLLQEYFMSKLKDFQKQCKANCINHTDEQFLLSSLVTQVKTVITENINSLEMLQDFQLEKKWKRAYLLMQQYLTLKLKRAHSEFNVSELYEYNNGQDFGTMLFKVCELIEADFKRILCLCTCKEVDIDL